MPSLGCSVNVCGNVACSNSLTCYALSCPVIFTTGWRDVVTPGRHRRVVATVYVVLCSAVFVEGYVVFCCGMVSVICSSLS